MIQVDSQVINYGSFYPGKLLGSTLLVTNVTNQEQLVELSIDGSGEEGNHEYDMGKLMSSREFSFFKEVCKNDDEKTDQKEFVPNSEKQYGCWYIENPMTKDLTKHITLRLGANCEQEFIIVMRAPVRKISQTILSFINLVLTTYDGSRSGYALEKHIKKRGLDSAVLQQKRRQSKMQVMLCGRVEPPKLVCCRELKDTATNNNVVPIALKKNQAC